MAEAGVSLALQTLRDLLLEEGRFLFGVGDEVRALQTQLKQMQSRLKDADRKQHESESVRKSIVEVRDLAYRAEDVIETYAFEVSSKRGGGLKNRLRRFSCIMKELHSLHQVGSEISKIVSDLAKVSENIQGESSGPSTNDDRIEGVIEGESSSTNDDRIGGIIQGGSSSTNDDRIEGVIQGEIDVIEGESSSTNDNRQLKRPTFPRFQMEDCFVGKDDELKRIVSHLVDDDQHRILSIWGMGGLGKTTIARKAYNHADTKRYFQCFAWVCITQQCQIISVLEDVLGQLNPPERSALSNSEVVLTQQNPSERDAMRYRKLIEELCQIQKDKRCIVVLDDMWQTHHWNDLKDAFAVQGLKSKIIVTTRNKKVPGIGLSIELGFLSMESGWELLKRKAFPPTTITPVDFGKKRGAEPKGARAARGGKKPKVVTRAESPTEPSRQVELVATGSCPPVASLPSKRAALMDLSGGEDSSAGRPIPLEELPLPEGADRVARWIDATCQKVAVAEKERDQLSGQLTDAQVKLNMARDEVKAMKAELVAQLARTTEAELKAENARADLEAGLTQAREEQGKALRAYTKRLLLSGRFTSLADELAGLINGNAVVDVLEEIARDYPNLDVSKYGYQRLEGAALNAQYATVVRDQLGQLLLLDELARSKKLLTAEVVASCSADRVPELDAAYETLPVGMEVDEGEAEVEETSPERPPATGKEVGDP